jgi:hypothetical protein
MSEEGLIDPAKDARHVAAIMAQGGFRSASLPERARRAAPPPFARSTTPSAMIGEAVMERPRTARVLALPAPKAVIPGQTSTVTTGLVPVAHSEISPKQSDPPKAHGMGPGTPLRSGRDDGRGKRKPKPPAPLDRLCAAVAEVTGMPAAEIVIPPGTGRQRLNERKRARAILAYLALTDLSLKPARVSRFLGWASDFASYGPASALAKQHGLPWPPVALRQPGEVAQ